VGSQGRQGGDQVSVAKTRAQVPPHAITGVIHARWAGQTLRTAIELGLFDALAGGARGADDLAAALGCPVKGVTLVADALAALGLIDKQDGNYRLSEPAELYLVSTSPLYLGPLLKQHDEVFKSWQDLTAAVRSGKPVRAVESDRAAAEFFPSLAAAIFAYSYTTAAMVADRLNVSALPSGARVLDVAAGSGVWSIPMAEANPGLAVDALDFESVLAETRRFASKYGVADRYRYLSGSWRAIELPEGAYDIVILGYILHGLGQAESGELLAKLRPALKAGGRVIVTEDMPADGRSAPAFPLLFAINMFLYTSDGCVFTLVELDRLLRAAGFSEVYRLELPYYGKESPVVVATRK